MHVKTILKVVLKSWDYEFFGTTTHFYEMLTMRPLLDQMYRVSRGIVLCWNLLWQIEICKLDFVWGGFWNPGMWKFLALQPVFMKCLLCAHYWTRCTGCTVCPWTLSRGKLLCFNLLWQIAICKLDFVWGGVWNPGMWKFLALQPVFMKFLLCALYWTRCTGCPGANFYVSICSNR